MIPGRLDARGGDGVVCAVLPAGVTVYGSDWAGEMVLVPVNVSVSASVSVSVSVSVSMYWKRKMVVSVERW